MKGIVLSSLRYLNCLHLELITAVCVHTVQITCEKGHEISFNRTLPAYTTFFILGSQNVLPAFAILGGVFTYLIGYNNEEH